MADIPENIILVDKPPGITSFDCIRRLRPVLGVKKMGHAGTLDPLATGLMMIGVGNIGTKKLNNFKGMDKTYEVTALMGRSTTTGDTGGETVDEMELPDLAREDAENAVMGLEGELELPVPLYSAVKRKGKPLYWYVRKGIKMERPIKTMIVKRAEFEDVKKEKDQIYIIFTVEVSAGTYVRSLVEELGLRLGFPSSVSALRRIAIGDISIKNALSLEDIESGEKKIDNINLDS